MGLWDNFAGKGNRGTSGELKPIVQRTPRPTSYSEVIASRGASKSSAVAEATPLPAPPPVLEEPEPAPVEIEAPPPPPAPAPIVETPKPVPVAAKPPSLTESLARLRRGVVLQARGEHPKAIEELTRAIELDPDCPDAYEARALSRDHAGDVEGAKADYAKAIGLTLRTEIDRQARENS